MKNIFLTKGTHAIDITPYELWFGAKPDVKHLRVWGCTAYSFIHPTKRTDKKWSPRAEKLMFIDYTQTTKQYPLYNPMTKKLSHSRDVVFHEDTFYFRPMDQKIFLPFTKEVENPSLGVERNTTPLPELGSTKEGSQP